MVHLRSTITQITLHKNLRQQQRRLKIFQVLALSKQRSLLRVALGIAAATRLYDCVRINEGQEDWVIVGRAFQTESVVFLGCNHKLQVAASDGTRSSGLPKPWFFRNEGLLDSSSRHPATVTRGCHSPFPAFERVARGVLFVKQHEQGKQLKKGLRFLFFSSAVFFRQRIATRAGRCRGGEALLVSVFVSDILFFFRCQLYKLLLLLLGA